jgi:hypothetical protein
VAEVEVQECYEGCPDSPNILDLCDPGTEEAAANINVNDSGKTNSQHLTILYKKKYIYIYIYNSTQTEVKNDETQ